MYEIVYKKKFKTAFKRLVRSGSFKSGDYYRIVKFLIEGTALPHEYYDHALTGNLSGQRECHIASDMLLVYDIDIENKMVTLANIGNHAQVFGS